MSTPPPANFDRLARCYHALELAAFGPDLHRVRRAFLERLRLSRHVLVLGEGDGRCLAQLVQIAPQARIDCHDASAAMLRAAAGRLPAAARSRVAFHQSDLRVAKFGPEPFDAVVTLFVLDCFTTAETEDIIQRVAAVLTSDAVWLYGDFAVPKRGFARARARVWLALLYRFFRWQTGLTPRQLPDVESAMHRAGFVAESLRSFQHGLLRSVVYRRRGTA